jgi:alpha-N-arabinofuranosidase
LACLAQLVNVIAPIMTNANGIMRQTIYYPYAWALKHARGSALSVAPEGPGYRVDKLGMPIENGGLPIPGFGQVEYVDISATLDADKQTATILMLNRDVEKPQDVEISWHDLTPSAVTTFETITGPDLKALNTFEQPNKVVPQKLENPKVGSRMSVRLPAHSYSVLTLSL